MGIIDTHLHLIDLERFSYPWLDNEPVLRKTFAHEQYLRQAGQAGIVAALHMEVDTAEADQEAETTWVTSIGQGIVGAIAGCRPEYETFPAQLERLAANPKVKGLRRTFHFTPDELCQSPLFSENIRRLTKYGLTYDLCALPRQLPIVERLAAACPDVQFILDHCGIPDVAGQAFHPWQDHLKRLAALPNVACKISGVVAYGGAKWTVADIRPFFEFTIDEFGWDRVVWGSDWPVCTQHADLLKWVNATLELLKGTSQSEQSALLGANAQRIYGLRSSKDL